MPVKLFNLVVPKNPGNQQFIGKVIGMSRFDLSIGPLLRIRDIISGEVIERFRCMSTSSYEKILDHSFPLWEAPNPPLSSNFLFQNQ